MSESRMTLHEVVMKLVGPVEPVGETQTDERRYENLRNPINLTDDLLTTIRQVEAYNAHRHEASMSKAGKRCTVFLDDLRDELGDTQ